MAEITKNIAVSFAKAILVAEDDEHDIFLLERAFQDASVNNPLYTVRDGQEAIEYLEGTGKFADRDQYPLPHLIILDLKMPRKSGMDVLRWLRSDRKLSVLPAIVFSSSAQPSDVQEAYENGANGFVVKPSGTKERAALVKTLQNYWLIYNEAPVKPWEESR